jgi:hypothetical protein
VGRIGRNIKKPISRRAIHREVHRSE